MHRRITVQIQVEVAEGSNVEVEHSMCQWNEDPGEIPFFLEVALLSLKALSSCLEKQGH